MKKISELFKDPYTWGLMVCGWTSVYFGYGGVALVIGTAWVTQKRMERLFDQRIKNAVDRGAIRLLEESL